MLCILLLLLQTSVMLSLSQFCFASLWNYYQPYSCMQFTWHRNGRNTPPLRQLLANHGRYDSYYKIIEINHKITA